MEKSQFQEAEQRARRIVELADKSFSDRPDIVAEALYMHGTVLYQLGNYADAEKAMERQISTIQRQPNDKFKDESIAWAANNLAVTLHALGKLPQAETRFRQAGLLFEQLEGPESAPLAAALHNLGNLCRTQGRFIEAEYLQRRALAIREKKYGVDHSIVAGSCDDLGRTLRDQKRYVDAEVLFRRAFVIFQRVSPESLDMALCVNNLGNLYRLQGRFDEAEPLHQKGLKIWQTILGKDSQDAAWTLAYLTQLEMARGRLDQAREYARQCRSILDRLWGHDHPDLAIAAQLDADLLRRSNRLDEAERMADKIIQIRDRFELAPIERANGYAMRAELRWSRGDRPAALADLQKALDLAELQHGQSSGADYERGNFFRAFADMFDTMIDWQVELNDVSAAYETMERSRAAVLRNQLNSSLVDPLQDAPAAEAARLKERESSTRATVITAKTRLEKAARQRSLTGEPSADEVSQLSEELRKAQKELISVTAEIRAASPVYRRSLARMARAWPLAHLQAYLVERDAVFLEYALGQTAGYVLVVSPKDPPRIERLMVSKTPAETLAIDSGPLTDARCRLALVNQSGTGIYQQISSQKERASDRFQRGLSAFSQTLLPESVRNDLAAGRIHQLIISPDSAIALMPFEPLVPGDTSSDRYVLDLTEQVTYTPFATLLHTLTEDRPKSNSSMGGVLSVGDPDYPAKTSTARALSQLSLYQGLGGGLSNLAAAKTECAWLAQNFHENKIAMTQLLKGNATEQAVRQSAKQRLLIHFACHGFADDRLGNAFGALALTPGGNSSDLTDDGFLTLSEISELDLRSCELAILSACETNVGPLQRGEGVWALSRGFLIAGSRRVVATNWMVDDEAAASLVSYFGGGIARDMGKSLTPDYAKRLHEAKKWVRKQEKWQSPYYWGGFVIVGPN